MKAFWFQLFGLVLVISVATYLAFNQQYLRSFTKLFRNPSPAPQTTVDQRDRLKITGPDGQVKAELFIELTDTPEKRSKGLGLRESLATDSGMLFLHDESRKYTYWMKGMQFPIDIIWISGDIIVDFTPNIPPPIPGQNEDTLERYASTVEVNRVLETNAGFVNQYNIQKGDKIILE